jgi:hypothetical protein
MLQFGGTGVLDPVLLGLQVTLWRQQCPGTHQQPGCFSRTKWCICVPGGGARAMWGASPNAWPSTACVSEYTLLPSPLPSPHVLTLAVLCRAVQHLGDFPHRLSQHCHAVYEYTPPPPMSWPELSDEIWCHRYYLANLCDEERFRNWPVVEHIPLLQVGGMTCCAVTCFGTVGCVIWWWSTFPCCRWVTCCDVLCCDKVGLVMPIQWGVWWVEAQSPWLTQAAGTRTIHNSHTHTHPPNTHTHTPPTHPTHIQPHTRRR